MTEQYVPPQELIEYDVVQISESSVQHWYRLAGRSMFMFEQGESGTAFAWSTRSTYEDCYNTWESLWHQSGSMEASVLQRSLVGVKNDVPVIDTKKDLVKQFIVDSQDHGKTTSSATCTWWAKDYSDGTHIKWDTIKYKVAEDSLGAVQFTPGSLAENGIVRDLITATATQEILDNLHRLPTV